MSSITIKKLIIKIALIFIPIFCVLFFIHTKTNQLGYHTYKGPFIPLNPLRLFNKCGLVDNEVIRYNDKLYKIEDADSPMLLSELNAPIFRLYNVTDCWNFEKVSPKELVPYSDEVPFSSVIKAFFVSP